MRQRFAVLGSNGWILAMAVFLALALPGMAGAESALERIERTGVFTAGTRTDAVPFAYRDAKGRLVGFSVDLLRQIHRQLEQRFGRAIELRLREVTASNRLELVAGHAIDIECGITTPTWQREEAVDFSIPFFGNGTRVMTLRSTATQLEQLDGKRIGVAVGTTTANILTQHVPAAILVEVPDMDTGFRMFEQGEIDGLANIGVVLRAKVEKSPLKSKVILLPRTEELSYEPMVCILPQDDSAWRAFVNGVLAELLNGVDQYRGAYIDIYDRWFGPRGVLYFPLDYKVAQRLAAGIIWLK